MKITNDRRTLMFLASGFLLGAVLAMSGCSASDLPAAERAQTTETVTVSAAPPAPQAQAAPLPDDRVVETPRSTISSATRAPLTRAPEPESTQVVDPTNGDVLTDQEVRFLEATCELLDQGYSVAMIMEGLDYVEVQWDAFRTGELVALSVMVECPEYYGKMADFLESEGY